MSQIRNIIVSIIALIILYFFVQTTNTIGSPRIFTLVAGFMVLLIIWNVVNKLIRGY